MGTFVFMSWIFEYVCLNFLVETLVRGKYCSAQGC